MNIRLIAGIYGGRMIDAPDSDRTHPMGERIRNALFNSLGSLVDGATVLDAFAGTGSVGLEALSRGAAHATFVEKDRVAQKILAKNITSLGAEKKVKVIRTTVSNWLETADLPMYDLIFADPPYYDPQLSTVERLQDLLKPNALMVLSHPGRREIVTKPGVVVVDNRSYGNATLTFFRRNT